MGDERESEAELLVVEDDAEFRESLADLLRIRGYSVRVAAHGEEALALLRSGARPCLILLDLMMPVMDGWDFRRALLRDPEVSKIPVVLISGASDVAEEARLLAAVGFLRKPCTAQDVFALVERHC
jgi:CheY-like chemotaxis protein